MNSFNLNKPMFKYGAALLFLSASFLLVIASATFPPITDLPQHLAQIRLLEELVGIKVTIFNRDNYEINWFSPNTAFYWPLWGLVKVFDPIIAGRIAMFLLAAGWASSILYLAAKRNLSVVHALLASVFILNLSFYWGFLNFLLAFPLFVVLIIRVTPSHIASFHPLNVVSNLGLLMVLLWCHSLWFLLAVAWYVATMIYAWRFAGARRYRIVLAFLPLIPLIIFSLIWFPQLKSSLTEAGYRVAPVWSTMPWDRLNLAKISDYILGGLRGPAETAIAVISLAWIGLCIYSNRVNLFTKIDRPIGLCALILWALFLFAPDFYMNTMLFNARWAAPAMIFTIMALPFPHFASSVNVIPPVIFISFIFTTCLAWKAYDDTELTGLEDSLIKIPENQRVLWLSFEQSPRFKNPPLLQIGALSQAISGSDVNFSFAELGTGIVSLRERRQVPWTRNLEWLPTLVKYEDLKYFDFVLVNGRAVVHEAFVKKFELMPIATEQRFKLYKL